MSNPYDEPTEKCPYCGAECTADFVDIGIGMQQCGPYHCGACFASEIGSYDSPRILTDQEKETGWYQPDAPVSDKANTVGGLIVNHVAAKTFHKEGILDPWGPEKHNPKPKKGRWIAHCGPCDKEFQVERISDHCPHCNDREPDYQLGNGEWVVRPRSPMSLDVTLRFEEDNACAKP